MSWTFKFMEMSLFTFAESVLSLRTRHTIELLHRCEDF